MCQKANDQKDINLQQEFQQQQKQQQQRELQCHQLRQQKNNDSNNNGNCYGENMVNYPFITCLIFTITKTMGLTK